MIKKFTFACMFLVRTRRYEIVFDNFRVNWKLLVRIRRCYILFDNIQSETVRGVSINWEHYENVLVAKKAMENEVSNKKKERIVLLKID